MSPPLFTGPLESDAPHMMSIPPSLILRTGSPVSYPLETRSSEVSLHPPGVAPPATAYLGPGALRTALHSASLRPASSALSRRVLQAPLQGC